MNDIDNSGEQTPTAAGVPVPATSAAEVTDQVHQEQADQQAHEEIQQAQQVQTQHDLDAAQQAQPVSDTPDETEAAQPMSDTPDVAPSADQPEVATQPEDNDPESHVGPTADGE